MMATLAAFLLATPPARAKLKVIATVPDLAAIARAVAGEHARVDSLSLPHQDPHFVDARPHLMLALNRADLLLVVGLEIEVGWLPPLLTGARNGRIQPGNEGYLDCSTAVELREVPQVRIDRSMGDIHPGGNPHYLVQPGNAMAVARAIGDRLAKLDPAHRAAFAKRTATFIAQLTKARQRWRAAIKPFRGTKVVAYHKAWIYFTDEIGLEIVGYLEPKPGIPPNAAHLLRLLRRMREDKVPLILTNSYYPDRATQLVARKSGAILLKVAGGANLRAGESFLKRMNRLVDQVAAALGKRGRR
jgi:zinc/manganese transport system substrate-binding protein